MARVSFALSDEMYNELSGRAGGAGVSAYVRAALEQAWGREDRNNALLAALDALTVRLDRDGSGGRAEPSSAHETQGALMELLLLMRAVAGPEKLRAAQAEVERLRLPVWGSSMFARSMDHE